LLRRQSSPIVKIILGWGAKALVKLLEIKSVRPSPEVKVLDDW
jgi:hypothetical protein